MSDKFKLAVFIGRFQPFHNSHKNVVEKALKQADNVLIILGSHNSARTIKNPFTTDERKQMIRTGLPNSSGVYIESVRDYHHSDNLWVSNIQSIVQGYANQLDASESEITIIANYKDESSYYLDLFPQWHKTVIWGDVMDATKIREIMFNENFGTNDFKQLLPEGTFSWLSQNFIGSQIHKTLISEQRYIDNYKHMWKDAPYPVTFVTADAVVIKSGHVLMVKRRTAPGKGLLALPGGFIKHNERIEDAAIRELKEETKIEVPKPVLKREIKESKVFDYPGRSLRGRTITHAYLIDLGKGDLPKVRGSDDAETAMWVPVMDLYQNSDQIFEDHLNIINYFMARK